MTAKATLKTNKYGYTLEEVILAHDCLKKVLAQVLEFGAPKPLTLSQMTLGICAHWKDQVMQAGYTSTPGKLSYILLSLLSRNWPENSGYTSYPVHDVSRYGIWEGPNRAARIRLMRYLLKRLRDWKRHLTQADKPPKQYTFGMEDLPLKTVADYDIAIKTLDSVLAQAMAGMPMSRGGGICMQWMLEMDRQPKRLLIGFHPLHATHDTVSLLAADWKHTCKPGRNYCYPIPNDGMWLWEGKNRELRIDLMKYMLRRLRAYRKEVLSCS